MNKIKLVLFLMIVVALSACAQHSGVVPVNSDTFTISRQAATGLGGIGFNKMRIEIIQEASAHCRKLGKSMEIVSEEQSKGPYIWANFPRIDMVFRCVNHNQ